MIETKDLQAVYEAWPQNVKDEFWRHLRHIFLWRGHDSPPGGLMGTNPRHKQVEAMAALFWEHGKFDIDQYT
jgi:hypothetical protein